MRSRPISGILALFVGLLGPAAEAKAHEYWLEPVTQRGTTAVAISLNLGSNFGAGEEKSLQKRRLVTWKMITPHATKDLLPEAQDGHKPILEVSPQAVRGGALFTMERGAARIVLDHQKFNAYLREEGLESILAERARKNETTRAGRESYTRYLKLYVPPEKPGAKAVELCGRRLDQKLEIVLNADPTRLRAGKRFAARVFFEGEPLPNAHLAFVRRTRQGKTDSHALATDGDGRVVCTVRGAGLHALRLVHMRRAPPADDDFRQPEWESYWASFVFPVKSR